MSTTEFEYAGHVGLSFGTVYFERLAEEPNDKPWATTDRSWVTAYRVTGPRIRGTVRIIPKYDEPLATWHNNGPNENAWEFLPTGFYVGYGRAHHADCEGDLEVWGSTLAEGVHVFTKRDMDWNFSVRRREGGIDDYPAPRGTRDKARELIRALVELHQQDAMHVYTKAVALAREKRAKRTAALREEYREVDRILRELQGRHAELQVRRSLMEGEWSFETAIDEAAPTADAQTA
ncbi:hypothetical protein K4B79_12340 [Streptomyces lincolnensis]|uniref:hypothetical protein n=1 Tax=Streptomyces lincolnensis TaxID=1915 RepID=UPI001E5655B0|nr:hypothetical protein [Streptomyces lincolnensis]MCD7439014.1 hypothetical protein [Streptomyces lincolnensis]